MNNDDKAVKVNEALKLFLSGSLAGAIGLGQSTTPGADTLTTDKQTSPKKDAPTNSQTESTSDSSLLPVTPPKKRRFSEGPSNREKRTRWTEPVTSNEVDRAADQFADSIDGDVAGPIPKDPLLAAVERAKESISHLGSYDPENKDTYEDALDSGGVIDGGTWEHRKRGKEMVNTAQISQIVNEINKNYQHVGNALPLEALDALLNSEGGPTSCEPANVDQAINNSNKGFKLLQKAGWTEGQGLGRDCSGITEPIVAKDIKVIEEASSTSENSDEFAAYRKRMMLAYRFRPNPLNNPRRSYDGYKTIYDSTDINKVVKNVVNENTNV
eukprot:Selendium_serpulae@DN6113_c0_g1_i10.p1